MPKIKTFYPTKLWTFCKTIPELNRLNYHETVEFVNLCSFLKHGLCFSCWSNPSFLQGLYLPRSYCLNESLTSSSNNFWHFSKWKKILGSLGSIRFLLIFVDTRHVWKNLFQISRTDKNNWPTKNKAKRIEHRCWKYKYFMRLKGGDNLISRFPGAFY